MDQAKPILFGVHIQYPVLHAAIYCGTKFAIAQQRIQHNMIAVAQMFNAKSLGKVVGIELIEKESCNAKNSILPAFELEIHEHIRSSVSSPLRDQTYRCPPQGATYFVMGYNAAYCVKDTAEDLKIANSTNNVYLLEDALGSQAAYIAKAWNDAARKTLKAKGVIFIKTTDVPAVIRKLYLE